MAIKGGQIIHDVRGFVVDRIQTGGVSSLNIPQEKIYETGNYQTVATLRDIPDLQFDVDGLDVSTELEALTVGLDPTTVATGDLLDFAESTPFDVISPFKGGAGSFAVVKGIIIPFLTLNSAAYKFGVGTNSSQTFTYKGDSVFYVPGSPYQQTFAAGGAGATYTLTHTAIVYVLSGQNIFVLSACAHNPTTGTYKRLVHGAATNGYTSNATSLTVAENLTAEGYTQLHVTYGSAVAATYNQTVHQGIAVKPAAVRGKDIVVYVGNGAATSTNTRWAGVQTFDVTRTVNLQADQELDNHQYVSQDYDIPDVKGSITVKSFDTTDLFDKINQIANVTPGQVVGPYSSLPVEVLVKIKDPDTGVTIKTIEIPDARFTLPNVQPKANTKLEVTFPFDSDGGQLKVYKGDKP
jgi:hypothetical protein